jgi:hypothetical protein
VKMSHFGIRCRMERKRICRFRAGGEVGALDERLSGMRKRWRADAHNRTPKRWREVREAPWEVGDVLECGDGAQADSPLSSGWGGGALDERLSGMGKRWRAGAHNRSPRRWREVREARG